jgi:hypothetical protein
MKTIVKACLILLINIVYFQSFSQNEVKVTIAGNLGENVAMTKADLLKVGELTISPSATIEANYAIHTFTFSFTENGLTKEIQNKGNRFNQIIIDAINNATPGSKFYFENIKVQLPDVTKKMMPAIVVKVTEK